MRKKHIPEIRRVQGIPTMYVDDEPFLALAGEVHNSAAYSLESMETQVWAKIEGMHLNTLIVPLYWETIEPEKGCYRFTLIDGLIGQALERGMHLIFLWFGLWKNGESMYVPGWMKEDQAVYFRAVTASGERMNAISPFCRRAVERDKAAFAAVMEHIRTVDEEHTTVIAMQVENEIGLLGTDRDYGKEAEREFACQIPEALAEAYKVSGDWRTAFGEDAGEYFMAYYFAVAVERITAAGQERYPLPCYTNAWLKQFPWYAGSYPSGGPVKEVHRIWKLAAPSLFALAPDIYLPNTAEVMEEYGYEGNPLFIPETRKDAVTASCCLYAFMKCHALCYSPFGIEDLGREQEEIRKPPSDVMQALQIDPAVFETEGGKKYLGRVYEVIGQIRPLYLQYRGTERMQSYMKRSGTERGIFLRFREYDLVVSYLPQIPAQPVSSGVVFELENNRFLIVGMMCTLSFRTKPGERTQAGILKLQEGSVRSGEWESERTLNGDEQIVLHLGDEAACLYVELYQY